MERQGKTEMSTFKKAANSDRQILHICRQSNTYIEIYIHIDIYLL